MRPAPTAKLMQAPLMEFPKGNKKGTFRVKGLNLVCVPGKQKVGWQYFDSPRLPVKTG